MPKSSPTLLFFYPLLLVIGSKQMPAQTSYHYSDGIQGYIWSASDPTSIPAEYTYGLGFYAAVWQLTPQPVRDLQIGLPSTWILPNNTDNLTEPLCPPGTVARDNWPERAPTYSDVFQTIEGGLGYWIGNQYHYGPPKYMMNSTPNCYNGQIATPGWPFFGQSQPLPDNELSIAQLSNRILIPPDGMPFDESAGGDFLGSAYLALPLSFSHDEPYPTGIHNWTLFFNAENFKGPLAYYVPETYSKISADYPFIHGRGLDARDTRYGGGGTMEIGTVPYFSEVDANGVKYTKIPEIQFPIDAEGRSVLTKDWTYYSKDVLYGEVLKWRDGGTIPEGQFAVTGIEYPEMRTGQVGYRQEDLPIRELDDIVSSTIFSDNSFGLTWESHDGEGLISLPQYFKEEGGEKKVIEEEDLPAGLALKDAEFAGERVSPSHYSAPLVGAWDNPASGPHQVDLADGSFVTYYWYRFIDQPVFQQYDWPESERDNLQRMVEEMHREWTIDKAYMNDLAGGELVSFDTNIIVAPPVGYEFGYVPVVTWQSRQGELDCNSLTASVRSELLYEEASGKPFAVLELEGLPIRPDITWHNGQSGMFTSLDVGETYSAAINMANCGFMYHYSAPIALAALARNSDSFVAQWTEVPGARGYALDVATDSLFVNLLPNYDNVEVAADNRTIVQISDPGTILYYRVRAQGFHSEVSDHSNVIRVDPSGSYCDLDLVLDFQSVSKSGASDGSASAEVRGGIGPYELRWSNGTFGTLALELKSDSYQVTATDSRGCQATGSVQVGLPVGSGSLGNRVWNDLNRNGFDDFDEPGIPGVNVALWFDADGDGEPERWMGFKTTDEQGYYRFTDLAPGIYQVFVWEIDNWEPGKALEGMVNSPGEADPNNDRDGDDNGQPGSTLQALSDRNIISKPIFLSSGEEPLQDGDPQSEDFDYDPSGNMTIDFGFYDPDIPCPAINVQFLGPDSICGSSEVLMALAVGGRSPYNYVWNTGDQGEMLGEVSAGNYEVTVTDRHGCQGSQSIAIERSRTPEKTYFIDLDNDGFGDESFPIRSCRRLAHTAVVAGDCNDRNASIHPEAIDLPNNGVDENCSDGDATTSTLGQHEIAYSIGPNPAHDYVAIRINNSQDYTYVIYSLSGTPMLDGKLDVPINVQSLAPGLYVIELRNTKGWKIVDTINLVR
ncbi:MAG: T9SS type A sorting domain-containing protein [Saprospiraceae bacterium]|nr:T9SS type A sorting domain-containing protein [Saprospiraceae bacterium]